MPLSLRRGASMNHYRPVLFQPDHCSFEWAKPRPLDVRTESDSRPMGSPAAGRVECTNPFWLVSDELGGFIKHPGEIAPVEYELFSCSIVQDPRIEGHFGRPYQVLATEIHGIHSDSPSAQFDCSLERERGLRSTRT